MSENKNSSLYCVVFYEFLRRSAGVRDPEPFSGFACGVAAPNAFWSTPVFVGADLSAGLGEPCKRSELDRWRTRSLRERVTLIRAVVRPARRRESRGRWDGSMSGAAEDCRSSARLSAVIRAKINYVGNKQATVQIYSGTRAIMFFKFDQIWFNLTWTVKSNPMCSPLGKQGKKSLYTQLCSPQNVVAKHIHI